MTDWADVVLVVAFVAPPAALGAARLLRRPVEPWGHGGSIVAVVSFAAVLLASRRPDVAGLEPDALALATAAGAFLVVLGLRRGQLAPGVLGAVAVALGAGAATSAGSALLGVAVAVAVTAPATEASIALVAAAGVAVAAAGGVALVVGLPVALVAAARRPGALAVVIPGLLVVGLRALPSEDVGKLAMVALAAAATAVALVARRDESLRVLPSAPVGLWALAAATAAVPGSGAATVLLAAAAVTLAVTDVPVGLFAALPGAVALGHALLDTGGRTSAVLAVLGAATALALAADRRGATSATVARVVGAVAAIWLALRPSAWALATKPDLGQYEPGAAIACAAALCVAVAGVAAGWTTVPASPPVRAVPPVVGSMRRRAIVVGVTAAMGLAAGALVRSSSL